jgi:ABC-type branched-subunit amino acid transport system substrate-binding protein
MSRTVVSATLSLLLAGAWQGLALFAPSPNPAYAEPSTVAVVTALTGDLAIIGTAVRNGVELAREQQPELFRSFSLQFHDTQFNPAQDLTVYRRFTTTSAHPKAILNFGLLTAVTGDRLEKDAIPVIDFNFIAARAVGKPTVTRAFSTTAHYMQAVANYLAADRGGVHIVHSEGQFESLMAGDLQRQLKEMGRGDAIHSVHAVLPKDSDFRSLLTKIRRDPTPRLGAFLGPDQLLLFAKQARALGIKATLVGTDLCESAAFLPGAEGLLEGCIYPDSEVSPEFRALYRGRFGNQAQLTFAGAAFEMARLVAEIVASHPATVAGPEFTKLFLAKLEQVKDRPGVLGSFSFRNEPSIGRYFAHPIVVKQIQPTNGS